MLGGAWRKKLFLKKRLLPVKPTLKHNDYNNNNNNNDNNNNNNYYYYYYYHIYSVQRNRFFEAIFTILNCK